MQLGCLPLIIFFWLIFLFPIFFADIMLSALEKLGLSAPFSVMVAFWIFVGGFINIPVKRIPRATPVEFDPYTFLGFDRFIQRRTAKPYTVIAVNVGGCIIPCCVVVYELIRLWHYGAYGLFAAAIAAGINIFICYKLARPIPKVGIGLPPFVPAIAAALCALVLLPHMAPPVAFIAGVSGPLIGADLMHLDDITTMDTPMGSIGGAGTFDGIVISGLFATVLA